MAGARRRHAADAGVRQPAEQRLEDFVELHGGQVTACSPGIGQGATFEVILPLLEDTTLRVATTEIAVPMAAVLAPSARPRILLVDDNADAAEALAEVPRTDGFEVRITLDPFEALSLADQFRPEAADPVATPEGACSS